MNTVETVGYLASFFSVINQFPQAVKVLKTKDTHSISLTMYVFVVTCITLWLVYGIMLNNGPLIWANALSLLPIWYIFLMKLGNTIKGKDKWGI
jgi:MtN3 and saliva related transmembrane protein